VSGAATRHAEWIGTGHFKGDAGEAMVCGRAVRITAQPFIVFFSTSTGEGTLCVTTYDEGLEAAAAIAQDGMAAFELKRAPAR
jgi:hypothetical protein